ncbi:AT-rich interactive domain-containing protein 2 [Iris pallida]|uniref:AT-rich interactive domain-containing protein 2 n=1 Tax=Iris pallida TaxID=29817 RepID=A0AAX6HQL7_IRIPA|nr:AT-rich interactive domain-containing protein 2 [Iris pallida]
MAGFSSSSSSLSVVELLRKLRSVGFCSEPDNDPEPETLSEEALSCLFERILRLFLAEIHPAPGGIRPVPALLGDGRHVDLFRLFFAVRDRGGFKSVTSRRAWGSVAGDIGSDPVLASSLKLVYSKYLEALDRWLEGVLVRKEKKKKAEKKKKVEEKEKQFLTPVDHRRVVVVEVDDDDKGAMDVKPEPANGGSAACNKRKREELVGMLNWVLRVARNPNGASSSIGKLMAKNGDKDKASRAVGEVYSLVLSFRKAMFLKKIRNTVVDGPNLQKGQRIHPCIYGDHVNVSNMTSEKVRCSQRHNSASKQSHSCPEVSTIRDSDMDKNHVVAGMEVVDGHQNLTDSSFYSELMTGLLSKDQKEISVGPSFQARVPAWTGEASVVSYNSDDLKWLGTLIWPPQNQESGPPFEQGAIGEGRKDNCSCKCPGSVECVRFHVAEKRFQLKHELGSAFHAWRFDCMGEEVALRWTEEEARKFKAIVRESPLSLGKNFWDQLHLLFPLKGSQNLVSYYFNVFVLARRSYQNRLTPNNVDSDDEETEFGFLSNPFGHSAIKVHAPKPVFCAQNAQCSDVDD